MPELFQVGKELTASLKKKRNVISDLYQDQINKMYEGSDKNQD
jgi:long-subunit acyl-CoA synthetase (AMP-forming)